MDLDGYRVVVPSLIASSSTLFVITRAEGHECRVVTFHEGKVTCRTLIADAWMSGFLRSEPSHGANTAYSRRAQPTGRR